MFTKIKDFARKNKVEFLLILFVVIISLALRLYRIGDFMTFLGDEGRDVRIVRDLITKGNLVFIGPQTSIGNMYLGPLYYYMMAPALLLSGLNPVGPAIMIALLGTFTVWLTWFVAREWFGKKAAFVAALLFAVSPVAIIYSRASWNPNPMPFFALLSVFGIYQIWQHKKYFWLPLTGIAFAFALQMHYLGLLLIPTLGVFWLLALKQVNSDTKRKTQFFRKSLIAVALFLVLMSPLLLFDIKHDWMNFNAFKSFFTDRQTTVNLNPARSDRFLPVMIMTVSDMVLARQTTYATIALVLIFILSVWIYLKSKWHAPLKVLFVWLGLAILGLSIYKQHVYIHYLGFIYPAIYLLLGAIFGYLLEQKFILRIVSVALVLFLAVYSLVYSPVKETPNRQLWRTEAAVDLIIKESGGEPFNFGLLAKQNYDESYRYFLENKNAPAFRGEEKITDQMFVICEDGDACAPEGNPAYQIAKYGQAHVVATWNLDYLKIYRLIHFK